MFIFVCPKYLVSSLVESVIHKKYTKVISITDPTEDDAIIPLPENQVCRVRFHDINEKVSKLDVSKYKLFDEDDARKISNFVSENDQNIIVHCHAGISRSPAIAAALSLYFISKESCERFFEQYIPNDLVFSIMCRVLLVDNFEEIIGRHNT